MVYRHAEPKELCLVCSSPETLRCRNCSGPHCDGHRLGASCHACTSQLWALENDFVGRVAAIYGSLGLPCLILAIMICFSGATAWLGAILLLLIPIGYFAIPRACLQLVRPRIARKKLDATSEPIRAWLPPAAHTSDEAPRPARHPRRRPAQRGGQRPVVVGRGLIFR